MMLIKDIHAKYITHDVNNGNQRLQHALIIDMRMMHADGLHGACVTV
jgi:hypothetical protein